MSPNKMLPFGGANVFPPQQPNNNVLSGSNNNKNKRGAAGNNSHSAITTTNSHSHQPESEFVELDPEACQADAEWMRILHEALELYRLTFLGPGSLEQSVESIARNFFNKDHTILVNLKKLPSRDKRGVAATAIVCVLKENTQFCHLDYLCVNSEYRGNGIGSVFMTQFVIPHILGHYKRCMTLECEEKLIRWYSKLGAKKLDVISDSMLGDLPALYSLMCFFTQDNLKGQQQQEAGEDWMTAQVAQRVLFEVRHNYHGMGKHEMIPHPSIEKESEEIDAGASATGEHSPSIPVSSEQEQKKKVTMIYKWYKTI